MSSPASAVQQDRAAHAQRAMFSLRRALVERRMVVDIGEFKFRFQRRGEVFEDGDCSFVARESGVFAYFRATAGGVEVPGRWVHLGSTDDLEDILKPYTDDFGPRQYENLRVELAANAALQSLIPVRDVPARERRSADTMPSMPADGTRRTANRPR